MTNDQKFVFLMNQVEDLLKTLDKVDGSQGKLFTHDAKEKRKNLKIFLIQNRLIVPDSLQVKPARPYNPHNSPYYKNLAR